MAAEFKQIDWSPEVVQAAQTLIQMAVEEDLAGQADWTTLSLVPSEATASARIVSRATGIFAGGPLIPLVFKQMQADVEVVDLLSDGEAICPGQSVGLLKGNAADLLTCERIVLNFLGRLSGIASLTRQFVDAVAGTEAAIYDTRKTTPGWRLLEKYAVRQGGGCNHRLGLYAAVMIKDNHVALAQEQGLQLKDALQRVRQSLAQRPESQQQGTLEALEVEVDSLAQLQAILPAQPDIVLLDNMPPAVLRQAVELRHRLAPEVVLEASGGVNLETIAGIASTGVDRISIGALTHSATELDLGLDWGA